MDSEKKQSSESGSTTGHKIMTVVGIVLCVILVPILVVNITLIIKGFINKDEVPMFGNYAPLIVLTDSMDPTISGGDLIIVKKVDFSEIAEGDVISFFDPESGDNSVVTHRVLKRNVTPEDGLPEYFNPENEPGIVTEDGKTYFNTQGDGNLLPDRVRIPAENLVGVWTGRRFAKIGSVAMFLQTTPGLIVCVALPIVLLVTYDVIRRRRYEKTAKSDADALMAELEALRKAQNAQNGDQTVQKDPGNTGAEPEVREKTDG